VDRWIAGGSGGLPAYLRPSQPSVSTEPVQLDLFGSAGTAARPAIDGLDVPVVRLPDIGVPPTVAGTGLDVGAPGVTPIEGLDFHAPRPEIGVPPSLPAISGAGQLTLPGFERLAPPELPRIPLSAAPGTHGELFSAPGADIGRDMGRQLALNLPAPAVPGQLSLDLGPAIRASRDVLQFPVERVRPPADLRAVHDLLLGAWRFAETAVAGRYQAARAGDVPGAWGASSSAAGALLLLSRAQEELRTLLEPPQLP